MKARSFISLGVRSMARSAIVDKEFPSNHGWGIRSLLWIRLGLSGASDHRRYGGHDEEPRKAEPGREIATRIETGGFHSKSIHGASDIFRPQ